LAARLDFDFDSPDLPVVSLFGAGFFLVAGLSLDGLAAARALGVLVPGASGGVSGADGTTAGSASARPSSLADS